MMRLPFWVLMGTLCGIASLPLHAQSDRLLQFLQLINSELRPAVILRTSIQTFKTVKTELLDPDFASQSLDKFESSTSRYSPSPLRTHFTDQDLLTLTQLIDRRRQILIQAETNITEFFVQYQQELDPLLPPPMGAILLLLGRTQQDHQGHYTTKKLLKLFSRFEIHTNVNIDFFPTHLLHPYAIAALFIGQLQLSLPLQINPHFFDHLLAAKSWLDGPSEKIKAAVDLYRTYRNQDNPPLALLPTQPDKPNVIFMDTGVDFEQVPYLKPLLTENRLSFDYADDDTNPWAPLLTYFGHGTGTMDSLYQILANLRPDLLSNSINLASWKVRSIRSLLSMTSPPYTENVNWENRPAYAEAIKHQLKINGQRPLILSISMNQLDLASHFTGNFGQSLNEAKWLWVMAAGNQGIQIEPRNRSCLSDFSPANRPANAIICVGSIHRSQDASADYILSDSNHGPLVDLYTYDQHSPLCHGKTSCATPAITTAATIIKADYPALSMADIKSLIMKVSVKRNLPIGKSSPTTYRTIRFFDPHTMIEQALRAAPQFIP